MGAVSNVGVLSNSYTVNKVLSARAAPEFAKTAVMAGLVYTEDLPLNSGTMVKGFKRQGTTLISATATLAEATALGIQAPRVDSVVDLTAAKCITVNGVSAESQKFGLEGLNSYVQSAGRAIARSVDDQCLALFPSVTNIVDTEDADLTVDDLDEAVLKVHSGNVPDIQKNLVFVASGRAIRQLKTDIRSAGGAAFSNERFLSIFNGNPAPNGYQGHLPGIDVFYASGLTEVSTDFSQCVFHPDWAFAGMYDRQINVLVTEKGSEGVYTEIVSYFFFAHGIWCQAAACEVVSPTT